MSDIAIKQILDEIETLASLKDEYEAFFEVCINEAMKCKNDKDTNFKYYQANDVSEILLKIDKQLTEKHKLLNEIEKGNKG